MLVYDVEAEDLDSGSNGMVDYMFYTSNGTTVATPEFRINPITGVIRAERVYDREEIDRYVVRVFSQPLSVFHNHFSLKWYRGIYDNLCLCTSQTLKWLISSDNDWWAGSI